MPGDKIGIRIALSGDDLPAGQVLAEPGQKGILREVLKPGRYPYNPYAESIELHSPVTIPAGFRGVVTRLAGPLPKEPNVFLVEDGERGVQPKTLEPGTYYLNPYETRVSLVDCRSRRFNLGQEGEMNFLSADGFPITLDGVVEFRILPDKVAEMFVKYNEDANGDAIDEEIIAKIITPESRSLCRIGGSKLSGGQFISGEDREKFQTDLVKSLTQNCQKQGIEILAVAITSIQPPADITAAGAAAGGRQAEACPVPPREAPAALRGEAEGRGRAGRAEEEGGRGRAGGRREDHQGRAGAEGGRDAGRAEAQGRPDPARGGQGQGLGRRWPRPRPRPR